MSRIFLGDDFLLSNACARELFHEHARLLPIVDYHCHLDPHALADDMRWHDIVDLWIAPDPYKWRLMRMHGVAEDLITGTAPSWARFLAWVDTLSHAVGNPVFHWSHLELRRFFDVDEVLTRRNAREVFDACNARLQQPAYSSLGLLQRMRVEAVCTSDDLLDDLAPHQALARRTDRLRMLPSVRADSMLAVADSGFAIFRERLAELTSTPIRTLQNYLDAILLRLAYFDRMECRVMDIGLDVVPRAHGGRAEAEATFDSLARGDAVTPEAVQALQFQLLLALAAQCRTRGWLMQLHMGAYRNTSSRMATLRRVGGYAAIGPSIDVTAIGRLLDAMEADAGLPRTTLFVLNPADTAMVASLAGAFTEAGLPGKVQLGPAWWFNDTLEGNRHQLQAVAEQSLLAWQIGMTTDSRSLLSFCRHEYYRRLMCNLLGEWVERGELPPDPEQLRELVQRICYRNAREFLRLQAPDPNGSPRPWMH